MRLAPKGFKCDICGKYIPDTFSCIKITTTKQLRGENNRKVSSDITTKTLGVNHLCEHCYFTVLERRVV